MRKCRNSIPNASFRLLFVFFEKALDEVIANGLQPRINIFRITLNLAYNKAV